MLWGRRVDGIVGVTDTSSALSDRNNRALSFWEHPPPQNKDKCCPQRIKSWC